jgi:PAS domain S-box-containing protein
VRVGVYPNSPKIGLSDQGEAEGIFADVLRAVAQQEGWTLVFVPGTWAQGLDRLAAGELDLMPDVALTQEREARFAFHREPVLSDWFQVYARRGSGIRSLPDLDGKRVALLERSIQEDALSRAVLGFDLNLTLVPKAEYAAAFSAVASGEADAVIANRFYGAAHAAAFKLADTAIIFNPTRLYFAAPRSGDPTLLEALDRHLKTFKNDPASVYYRSLKRWTSEETAFHVPPWVRVAGLAAAGLLAASVIWTLALRQQVAIRTRELARRHAELQAAVEEREQVAQALKESELKHRMLFENANDAILLMRLGCFLDCNARALAMFGCRRDQLVGAPPHAFSPPVQPDGRSSRDSALEKIGLALAGTPQCFEWEHWRLDKTPFMAEVSLNRLDLGGEPLLQAVVRDITERKRAEAAIRELNTGLERRVAERTAELAVARDRAEAADRLKSAFLATMSHELRTPLNSIIGFTGIILQELAGPLTGEQRKQLEMVRASARHLLALINDVLDISKIEAGQLEVARVPFDLRASLGKVAELVRPLAEKKGLVLRVTATLEIGTFTSDPRRVEQILLNLLNNAVKFTERGSVTLSAAVEGGKVRLAVADTGIGIRPEDAARLFQPFRQVDTGLARQHEGTGLGLAICRRLAGLLGGEIAVASEPGQGSVFTVVLPMKGDSPS